MNSIKQHETQDILEHISNDRWQSPDVSVCLFAPLTCGMQAEDRCQMHVCIFKIPFNRHLINHLIKMILPWSQRHLPSNLPNTEAPEVRGAWTSVFHPSVIFGAHAANARESIYVLLIGYLKKMIILSIKKKKTDKTFPFTLKEISCLMQCGVGFSL